MKRSTIALFFSIAFAILSVAPSILVLVSDNHDIVFFMDVNDEEEKKGEEKVKDFEKKVVHEVLHDYAFYEYGLSNIHGLHLNSYSSLFKELISPPPETNVL